MINMVYFTALVLVFIRMLSFFVIVPVFFPKATPSVLKIGTAAIMAYILMPAIKISQVSAINGNFDLAMACINEVVTGLVLGYITSICFSTIQIAGQLIDMQMGFSMISMFDPNTGSIVSLLERLVYWISILLFFAVDGHHMLINAMVGSFDTVALGKSLLFNDTIMLVINAFIQFFALGLKIAIPIVLIILITDITMGLVARTVPQLNIMILGLPIKILVGLTCFSILLPVLFKELIQLFNIIPDIYKGIFKAVPLMLIFASEEKTEEATPHKKRDARNKGQIAKSKEVSLAITLLSSTLIITTLGSFIGNNVKSTLIYFLNYGFNKDLTETTLANLSLTVVWRVAVILSPVLIAIMVSGVFASYIQTGFIFTGETIKPKLSKLNPISGFKKMFSSRTVVELFKDILIVSVVGYIGYSYVKASYPLLMSFQTLGFDAIVNQFSKLIVGIFFRVTLIMVIIALADYIYQRYMHNKELRMTKQEVKEEFKQNEGDPQIKSKIKQKQREMSMKRMMQNIPSATVVVTNPTHIAVALKYEEGVDSAPTVVAKGSDYLAIKIKEIAKEHEIPIIENKPLARLIFAEVEVEASIPVDMYQAVAEILALIYKMKKKTKK